MKKLIFIASFFIFGCQKQDIQPAENQVAYCRIEAVGQDGQVIYSDVALIRN